MATRKKRRARSWRDPVSRPPGPPESGIRMRPALQLGQRYYVEWREYGIGRKGGYEEGNGWYYLIDVDRGRHVLKPTSIQVGRKPDEGTLYLFNREIDYIEPAGAENERDPRLPPRSSRSLRSRSPVHGTFVGGGRDPARKNRFYRVHFVADDGRTYHMFILAPSVAGAGRAVLKEPAGPHGRARTIVSVKEVDYPAPPTHASVAQLQRKEERAAKERQRERARLASERQPRPAMTAEEEFEARFGRDPARALPRGPRRGRGRRTIYWEEKEDQDGDVMIWVYVREPGAAEWAMNRSTIMGDSWGVEKRRGDFAYASFPAYEGWLADAKSEYPNTRFEYLPYTPPRAWIGVR